MMLRPLAVGLGLLIGVAGAVLGPPGHARAAVEICRVTSSDLDLNGDGYDDAVVGDPYASVGGRAGAGAVVVLYGDADRRIGQGGRLVITQATISGSNPEAGDHFGWSVAIHDMDGDGCADLLVGSPDEDWAGSADAGIVQLVAFTPDGRGGPGTDRTQLFDQGDLGGQVEAGDRFGRAVSAGGGGDPAAVIGAPGEDVGGAVDAGAVSSFYVDGDQVVGGGTTVQGGRLPGTPEPGDRLGASVLVAPLWVRSGGGDVGTAQVFVTGAPGDTVQRAGAAVDGAGSVTSWEDIVGWEQVVTQESAGVPGLAETGDGFGSSLAFSEPRSIPQSVPRRVAVGSPGEDVGSVRDAGSVTVLDDGPPVGMAGGQVLTQDTAGFAGSVEAGDRFGHSVAFRADRYSSGTLVIGVPHEDIGSVADAGLVQIVNLDAGDGTAEAGTSYTENSAGTPGRVAAGNRFGLTVAGIRGIAESVVAISSPYQGAGSVFVAAQDGTTRAWLPGSGGIPASSGRFGWSVAGLHAFG